MSKSSTRDVGSSVRDRLLRVARTRGEDYQYLLTRYANERLLFRLASSRHAQRFVLKGAALFTVWTGKPHRATRDLDLLGFGELSPGEAHAIFSEVVTLDVMPDGVWFDPAAIDVGLIREDQAYGGVRVVAPAHIKNAVVRVQVDVGFGDAITPAADLVEFPALLDFPAPKLRAYPRETVVAEKAEAMVQLGMSNSRMKDFFDIDVLSRDFDFDGPLLTRAVRATFERRKTALTASLPVALTPAFAADPTKRTQWAGFIRKAGIAETRSLEATVEAVRTFIAAPLAAAATGDELPMTWRAGGPWR
jgi:hypothetical protein